MPADPESFAIETSRREDGVTTVAVAGEVDLATADELSRAITGALARGDAVLDLRAVTFMDSAGVRALNAALREAAQDGRALRVAGPLHPSVSQVLELTGMLGLLQMVDAP